MFRKTILVKMTSLSENSEVTTSVVEGKLNTVIVKLEEAEARLVLLMKLKKLGMCTKDILLLPPARSE